MSNSAPSKTHARRRTSDYLDYLVSRTGLAAFVAAVFFFLWLPMIVIVVFSFSGSGSIHFPPESFTVDWYIALFAPEQADVTVRNPFRWSALTNSLIIAVIASTVVVVLGLLSGYALNKYDVPGKQLFQLVSLLPIIVPLIVTAIGMVIFFSVVNVQLGLETTLIAHIVYTFPFGVLIITSGIAQIDTSLEEAARDLGSSEFRVFRKILLPLLYPSILATWVLVFTLSLNEFVITYFVSGAFVDTLPIWVWDQLRSGVSPLTYVVSAMTLYAALVLILIVHRLIGIQRVRG